MPKYIVERRFGRVVRRQAKISKGERRRGSAASVCQFKGQEPERARKTRRGAQGIAFRKLRRETIWVLVPAAHDPHPAGEGQCYTKAKPAQMRDSSLPRSSTGN